MTEWFAAVTNAEDDGLDLRGCVHEGLGICIGAFFFTWKLKKS